MVPTTLAALAAGVAPAPAAAPPPVAPSFLSAPEERPPTA
jgi:hypothetical protein